MRVKRTRRPALFAESPHAKVIADSFSTSEAFPSSANLPDPSSASNRTSAWPMESFPSRSQSHTSRRMAVSELRTARAGKSSQVGLSVSSLRATSTCRPLGIATMRTNGSLLPFLSRFFRSVHANALTVRSLPAAGTSLLIKAPGCSTRQESVTVLLASISSLAPAKGNVRLPDSPARAIVKSHLPSVCDWALSQSRTSTETTASAGATKSGNLITSPVHSGSSVLSLRGVSPCPLPERTTTKGSERPVTSRFLSDVQNMSEIINIGCG
mmetsp:Transcript_36145/g.90249  ORF Transcript_36145/g.90249 Transcript_36145/m.90249 type:complete len:269 (+) Transcript_36145:1744-2550(+)